MFLTVFCEFPKSEKSPASSKNPSQGKMLKKRGIGAIQFKENPPQSMGQNSNRQSRTIQRKIFNVNFRVVCFHANFSIG